MSTPSASVLVEPLDAYLRRRARSSVALAPGEAVTMAVAMLRGCRDATGRTTGARWWLRADGCPVVVEQVESPDAIAATAVALEHLAAMAVDDATRDMVARAREGVLTLPPREWDALERRFFQLAAPLPLVLGPLTPVEREAPPEDARVAAGSAARLLALVDADLAVAVGEALSDLRARWRSSRAIRLGAVCAAGVLVAVAGVLAWPPSATPGTGAADASTARAVDVRDPIDSPMEMPTPLRSSTTESASAVGRLSDTSGIPATDDPVASARALFEEVGRCAGAASCTAMFTEDADARHDPLLAEAATAEVDLIDDFGGVVVVRLSRDAELQYVTLVRQEDRWLVRAVETVADQPS